MTTAITVDAHAGWPVQVETIRGEPGQVQSMQIEIVQPNTKRVFYIHSGMTISRILEIEKDE